MIFQNVNLTDKSSVNVHSYVILHYFKTLMQISQNWRQLESAKREEEAKRVVVWGWFLENSGKVKLRLRWHPHHFCSSQLKNRHRTNLNIILFIPNQSCNSKCSSIQSYQHQWLYICFPTVDLTKEREAEERDG